MNTGKTHPFLWPSLLSIAALGVLCITLPPMATLYTGIPIVAAIWASTWMITGNGETHEQRQFRTKLLPIGIYVMLCGLGASELLTFELVIIGMVLVTVIYAYWPLYSETRKTVLTVVCGVLIALYGYIVNASAVTKAQQAVTVVFNYSTTALILIGAGYWWYQNRNP